MRVHDMTILTMGNRLETSSVGTVIYRPSKKGR